MQYLAINDAHLYKIWYRQEQNWTSRNTFCVCSAETTARLELKQNFRIELNSTPTHLIALSNNLLYNLMKHDREKLEERRGGAWVGQLKMWRLRRGYCWPKEREAPAVSWGRENWARGAADCFYWKLYRDFRKSEYYGKMRRRRLETLESKKRKPPAW